MNPALRDLEPSVSVVASGIDYRGGEEHRWRVLYAYDDGGRKASGFRGKAGDCVARAITIATERDYREVYDELARRCGALGHPRSARNGVPRKAYQPYLESLGWKWVPTMKIGSGCTVHLREQELPSGRLVVRTSRHIVAVVDGVIRDTHDPSRGGTRCVYGYFQKR